MLAVAVALAALGAALWQLPLTRHQSVDLGSTRLDAWAVALATGLCELIVLHLQLRREAHGISISELAVVLGLFLATPGDFVLGRALGGLVVFVAWRRQRPLKLLFNSALYLAESTLALLIFHAIRPASAQLDPLAWLAAAAACIGLGVLATVAVTAVIALVEREWDPAGLGRELVRTVVGSGGVSCAGLVPVYALSADWEAAGPLLAWTAVLLLMYRAHTSLSERHAGLERLHRFSRALSASPEADRVLVEVLEHARLALHGEVAEVVFLPPDRHSAPARVTLDAGGELVRTRLTPVQSEDPVWRAVIDSGTPVLLARGGRDAAAQALLDRRGLREALIAPLAGEDETLGTLLVGDRMGRVRGFDDNDLGVLTTVAAQAGMALRHGELAGRLQEQERHDPLTGLPNRSHLVTVLTELLGGVGPEPGAGGQVTVLVLDLVGFQQINESLGIQLADQVLIEVAGRIKAVIGHRGLTARLTGDQFVAVLPEVGELSAVLEVVHELRHRLEPPVAVPGSTPPGLEVEVGAWIGIAQAPGHGRDATTLLRCATSAVAEAKQGSIGWHLHTAQAPLDSGRERLALIAELRRGLHNGEVELFVQPQARAASGDVVAVEALVRWRHPVRGLVGPDEFVPLAERSGLIQPLTSTVLALAVGAVAQWRRDGLDTRIAVNLSTRSMLTNDIVGEVSELLARHRVSPESLVLEITESSVIRDPARTRAVLDGLHQLGVNLSVDDFGTGYSTLSYLRELPVQEVKIDRSFVWTMLGSGQDEAIVRSVIDLAGKLGLVVVAEGVEDAETWEALHAMGCDLIQGYYLARPMPIADFPSWLSSWQRSRRVPGPRRRPAAAEAVSGSVGAR